MSKSPWAVALTIGIYRLLLFMYPAAFRRAFGESMAQLVRDTSLDVYRRRGLPGLVVLWAGTAWDHLASVLREHRDAQRARAALVARCLGATSVGLAVVSLGLWVSSCNNSIGLFGVWEDLEVSFTHGVVQIRHIYARRIEEPVPWSQWYETATRRGWVRPVEPEHPVFSYSTGHVLGIGGIGCNPDPCSPVWPAAYSLLRIPLWVLMIPALVWGARALRRLGPVSDCA